VEAKWEKREKLGPRVERGLLTALEVWKGTSPCTNPADLKSMGAFTLITEQIAELGVGGRYHGV
jgi:energy-converting hydrogenase Eha subunit B